jgi:hypothetical protein
MTDEETVMTAAKAAVTRRKRRASVLFIQEDRMGSFVSSVETGEHDQ